MKSYTFHVSLRGRGCTWCKIELWADPTGDYPRVVESVGKSPPQYRDWDDE